MSPRLVLLADDPARVSREIPQHTVIGVREYLSDGRWSRIRGLRVLNLCHNTQYRSPGYYASLLAEARGQRVLPSVRTLQDLSRKRLYATDVEALERSLDQALENGPQADPRGRLELMVFFGEAQLEQLRSLSRSLFEAFPAPILRVQLKRNGTWQIDSIRTVGLRSLESDDRPRFLAALGRHLGRRWAPPRDRGEALRYDLAILHDPEEALAPSNHRALNRFIRAGRELGIEAELITRKDLGRLGEYDALFIRETTAVNHHTYLFARTAASEGLVVIDDPDSILRCTNKIFLKELLEREGIPTPPSLILTGSELDRAESELGYPVVLKVPDGSFSRGVVKAADRAELEEKSAALFQETELLLAQAFVPTRFDWRIGVLAGEPLFACRYHMSRGHWQILDHQASGGVGEGDVDTLPLDEVPPAVLEAGIRAARAVGDGLYGVDVKETEEGVMVIEVNDNPNIDAGYEDRVLGKELYLRVMREFSARLDKRTQGKPATG
jgi:glutathione synthase/RimK-type ligase-like ATP-grasp enzyme